jgi:hypothetical protein
MLRLHYTRIVDGYEAGLRAAQASGDVDAGLDPEVTAWALMGAGELIGMRFLLWERDDEGSPGGDPRRRHRRHDALHPQRARGTRRERTGP